MADTHTTRLCVQIIHSHFGPLAAKVADALLSRGRLSLPQITRQTALKPRIARAVILVLIQHGVAWHAQTDEEGEVIEFNADGCLMRLRFGRFVQIAEELYGDAGSNIVQLILDHGKLRSPDIMAQLTQDDLKSVSFYDQTLFKLIKNKYLKAAIPSSHVSPRDTILKLENEEKAKIAGFPTAKELLNAKETAEARLRRTAEDAEKIGLKRKTSKHWDSQNSSTKRKNAEEENAVDEEVFFRVNYDKFNVHIRNNLIETAARERFNYQAALVLRTSLRATLKSQTNVSETKSESISVNSIAASLPEDADLSSGLNLTKRNTSDAACLKHYLGILASADNPTPAGRVSSFITYHSSKVEVEFEIISRRLRRRVLEAFTRERHGSEGVRIVRCLLETGKMDEKQVSKVVMMPGKDVRTLLTSMSSDSIVGIQEVPRSADRNPTRTFYLWFVDQQKAYSVILGNLYKTLFNIGIRRQAEEEEPMVKAVLEKRQRSDVSQDESLLSQLDQDIFSTWEQKESKLTVLEMRVEESVFVIRDLGVLGIDDDT